MRSNLPVTQHAIEVPDGELLISITDTSGRIVFVNRAFTRVSGYQTDEMLDQPHNLIRHPDMPAAVFADMWASLKAGHSWSGLLKNRCKNGDHYWVRANVTQVRDAGKLTGYMSVRVKPAHEEIEFAAQIYEQLRDGRARGLYFDKGIPIRAGLAGWTSLFKRMSMRARIRVGCAATALLAVGGGVVVGAEALPGVAIVAALSALIGSLFLERQLATPLTRLLQQAQDLAAGQPVQSADHGRTDEIGMLRRAINQSGLNLLALRSDVASVDGWTSGREVQPAVNSGTVQTAVSEIIHSVERIEKGLRFDALTGAYNRFPLIEKLHAYLAEIQAAPDGSRPVHALLFIDLDNFKAINDQYGHDAGDRVLVTVVDRLWKTVRGFDAVARYGGDEFCVLLHNIGKPGNAQVVAEKIRGALADTIETEYGVIRASASIGWAIPGEDGYDVDALLKEADRRMMEVKASAKAGRTKADIVTAQELYGPAWEQVLTALTGALQPRLPEIVDRFYEQLAEQLGAGSLIRALAEPELKHLKAQQVQNLLTLISPELTEADHRNLAFRIGHIHAAVGLAREDLVLSYDILHTVVRSHTNTVTHAEALSLVGRRRVRDLAWQMHAFQELQSRRYALLSDVTAIAWKVKTHVELIDQVTALLCKHEEIAGCIFAAPDDAGIFRFDTIGGKSVQRFITETEIAALNPVTAAGPLGEGAIGRAWRLERIAHCANYATDLRVAPWKVLAAKHAIRSSVALPLHGRDHRPHLVLTLFSGWPGGYMSADHRAFITQLQSSLVFALHRISSGNAQGRVMPYNTRWHMAELLRARALEMFYQPIVDLHTGKMMKVEALARLRDGDRILTPAEFFPALSDTDFVELYLQGLEQVLTQRSRWLEDGVDVPVALNLPTASLTDTRYYDATLQALQAHGCPPHRLTLEVLETGEIEPGVDVYGALEKFKALGIHLAEDDLGSGYSSLNRLNTLPFDTIKIDRSIVASYDSNPADAMRFIYQLTRLGHALDKTVIVEGVENADLLNAARILGVDGAQGYAVARPMPALQLTQWIADTRTDHAVAHDAAGTLSELAKFVLWEERLHALLEAPGTEDAGAGPMFPGTVPETPALSGVSPTISDLLVSAIRDHGMRSAEYGAMRDQVLATLTATVEAS
jgi:diguanylate cyclase (GGDEF)-like protein/PAS domain S-box-containing protein